jgi:hypothetical protein
MMSTRTSVSALALTLALGGCSGSHSENATGQDSTAVDGGTGDGEGDPGDPSETGDPPAGDSGDAGVAVLSNRDRLIGTYFDYLKAHPDETQSNGLRGADLVDVCDLWTRLDVSSQSTFLTLTARLQGSILGVDGSSMLDHVTAVYRVVGGEGAVGTEPGSCGGGEFNRMIMSMDAQLHASLVAANTNEGDPGPNGNRDIADIPEDGFWRDSGDAAGPHDPFDLSDETDDGAPRGQVHFFIDPASPVASSPLGRLDLAALVDPFALEMDHDYDCAHNSNPMCEYTFYGPLCFPQSTELGLDIYTDNYGSVEPDWRPTGC